MYLLIGPRSASFTLTTRSIGQSSIQGVPFRVRRRSYEERQVRELCDGRPLSRTVRGAVARLIGERGKPTAGLSLGSFISDRIIQFLNSGVGSRDNQTARRVQLISYIDQNRYRSHDGLRQCERLFPYFSTPQKFCKAPSIEC